jgi:hypothetical protein
LKTRLTLAALSLLLAAGCASAPATPVAPTTTAVSAEEGVTAEGTLAVLGTSERRVLTPIATPDMIEYVKGDVGKVVLKLYRDGGGTPVQTATLLLDDNGQNQLDDTVKFTKLGYQSTYTVVATAFLKTDLTVQIDNTLNVGDAPSLASCTTTFSTGVNPTVSVGKIAVQLRKQVFNGQSNNTNLEITDGEVADVVGTETITITP